MLSTIRDHASACAALHCCTTPSYAAAALNLSQDEAVSALREATAAGLFRRLLLPGRGNAPVYQPTAKAGGVDPRRAAKFLRAGLSESSGWRGLLRGGVVVTRHSNLTWLTSKATVLLCDQHSIPSRGHAEPLIARDEAGHYQVHVLVPPGEASKSPAAVIGSAAPRWLPLLEHGANRLHFATLSGHPADAMQAVLSQLVPASQDAVASELAALEARIAADATGVARVQLAGKRAELAAVAAATPEPAFPWLAREVVRV
jgi:hypothetical protein